jgi:hypothetical protein
MPKLREFLRWSATVTHGAPTSHDALRRQAIKGLRHEFTDEFAAKCSADGIGERAR